MALWLFRAGRNGEYEQKFLNDRKIYLTWDALNVDLSSFKDKNSLNTFLIGHYAFSGKNTVRNWNGQIWPIANVIQKGDWVVLPSKLNSTIHFGEVAGDYVYDPHALNPFFHARSVNWFAIDVPRSLFPQDLLYSFGAFMTVCRITRNDAEKRIRALASSNWNNASKKSTGGTIESEDITEEESYYDAELIAQDQLAKLIISKYKGHGMAVLIEAILRAKGYVTHRSPEGPDKGVDILAGTEPMGFGNPRLCVQVKSADMPIERVVQDQLIGTMQNFGAHQGLLVSWGGFKKSIENDRASQFFRVRLWGQKEIIHEFLSVYEKLDEEIRAEIPLKRIWVLSGSFED